MNKDKHERNQTALLYLFLSLIIGSFVSFSGWIPSFRGGRDHIFDETVINPTLGGIFLFFAFLTIVVMVKKKK